MGFPRQEYWSGLPFPSPGDLLDSGIKLMSPAFQADSLPFFTSEPSSPLFFIFFHSSVQFSSVAQSCPTLTPWTAAHQAFLSITNSRRLFNSYPLSRWCHPTISSSVLPFSFCPQSFPTSGSFPMGKLFALGGQISDLQFQHQSFQWIFRADFL